MALAGLLGSPAAWADEIDDILNAPKAEETVRSERAAVRAGDTETDVDVPSQGQRERRLIKTLQQKTFLKLGRYEATPHLGFVTNDPFINRYIVGAGFTYHPTEILGLELDAGYSPNFGEGDWKVITKQLVNENRVSPDISKITFYTTANFQFSPIYGKLAVVGANIINFDVFGVVGTGLVHTEDDLKALQCEGVPRCEVTKVQNHLATNLGGGFRVIFNDQIAARLEARSMIFVETVKSTTLEYKNNVILQGSVSFFFPEVE